MSAIDHSRSLLGHDDGLPGHRWKEDIAARTFNRRRLIWATTISLIISISFIVLYSQWHSQSQASASKMLQYADPVQEPRVEGNLKSLLHPEDHVSREPAVRGLQWNITKARMAPNGVRKDVFLINGQFPGPTIEARSGDILEIEIFNFAEEEVSLHWHGLHMRGANHMDGPVGVTQCTIKHGRSFTYRIPTDEQEGTFWYHAHSEVQRADGLYGGLVIHNPIAPTEASIHQYDSELLFLVGDWYHWPASKVLGMFMRMTSRFFHRPPALQIADIDEPVPDSILINGIGHFECSKATHGAPVECSEIAKPSLTLDKQLRMIQVDGGLPVAEIRDPVNSVGVLYPAERVDFVLSWLESAFDTETVVTIALDKENFLRPNPALTPTQSFLLLPDSSARQLASEGRAVIPFNLRTAKGPSLPSPLPEAQQLFMVWSSITILNRLAQVPHGMINRTFWEPQPTPLISTPRESWNEHQLVPWTGKEPHGYDFYVIASFEGKGGWDYYDPWKPSRPPRGGPFNVDNPLRKDTVYVPPWGYVVIRFLADNAGIWTLHCHILWHQGSGMAMAFQVMGDEQSGFSTEGVGKSAEQFCVA
ncbi:Cell surface ferroxidase fetC [Hyphodiscus hymeniophilus]|uniref:Cell surface ferroxidase fetC n=1 Tax=Hyphodiscus hymeniophilus TaxID=353542 RepID=A0A9P7AUT9_9HELO|nr:Cell surface ferroxidase fetC [Hyphodiscus hymeniophilus]